MTNYLTKRDEPEDGIEFLLTAKERSDAALYQLRLVGVVRARNELDAQQAKAEALGNAARLGVVEYP